jgi:hypothetical protein
LVNLPLSYLRVATQKRVAKVYRKLINQTRLNINAW